MKKILLICLLTLFATSVSASNGATTAINMITDILCKVIFVLYIIAPGIGSIIVTMEGIRWISSSDDPGARKKAKEGIIHVIVGLIIVMLAIPLIAIVMAGAERFYACVNYMTSVGGQQAVYTGPAVLVTSGSHFMTTLKLYEGWNLISVPFYLDDQNVSHVFSNVDYNIVYSWNSTSKQWDYHIPDVGGNLTYIEIDKGYWILVNRNATLVLTGNAPISPRNVSLIYGWNLIGYSGYTPSELDSMLTDVPYMFVYAWNTTQASSHIHGVGWQFRSPSNAYGIQAPPKPVAMKTPSFVGMHNITFIEQSHGYWIYVYQNHSLIYPSNYPV